MTVLNVLSSKLSDRTPDLLSSVRGINLQILPKISFITYELTRKIYKRNYMKKISIQENSATAWERYKQAQNEVNNAINSAKKQYFTHNLEVNKMNPRKIWKLIDDLSSRKYGRVRNISEIKVNNEPISSAAEMAEVFNDFFCNYWIKFGK